MHADGRKGLSIRQVSRRAGDVLDETSSAPGKHRIDVLFRALYAFIVQGGVTNISAKMRLRPFPFSSCIPHLILRSQTGSSLYHH